MPKMVTIEANPAFKPDGAADAAAFKAIAPRFVAYVTAMEAIKNSKGMYRIRTTAEKTPAPITQSLEDMPIEMLKMMMLTAGVSPTKKQMLKADIIALIRKKMADIDIADPEPEPS